jgi:hypothetical protein
MSGKASKQFVLRYGGETVGLFDTARECANAYQKHRALTRSNGIRGASLVIASPWLANGSRLVGCWCWRGQRPGCYNELMRAAIPYIAVLIAIALAIWFAVGNPLHP